MLDLACAKYEMVSHLRVWYILCTKVIIIDNHNNKYKTVLTCKSMADSCQCMTKTTTIL